MHAKHRTVLSTRGVSEGAPPSWTRLGRRGAIAGGIALAVSSVVGLLRSGGYDAGAYGGSQFGGQMGAAPIAAQPEGNYGGPIDGGAAPCNGGQCGGDSCGFGGCRLGLGCLGCCGGLGHCCCIRTTGDLVQHTPFFGTTHGYYYFRQLVPGTYRLAPFGASQAGATPFWTRAEVFGGSVAVIDAPK